MKVTMPTHIFLERKKGPPRKMLINLNNYRNWHYFISNEVKKEYAKIAKEKLGDIKFDNKIYLVYILYKRNNNRSDRNNFLSIHDKFFCDSLVSANVIADDSDRYIAGSYFGGSVIDKENPRVEIFIFNNKEDFEQKVKEEINKT